MGKNCKNTCLGVTLVCSPAFRTLRLLTKHYILILSEQWKNHNRGISKKLNTFSRAALIGLASDWYYKTLFESKSTERAKFGSNNAGDNKWNTIRVYVKEKSPRNREKRYTLQSKKVKQRVKQSEPLPPKLLWNSQNS